MSKPGHDDPISVKEIFIHAKVLIFSPFWYILLNWTDATSLQDIIF